MSSRQPDPYAILGLTRDATSAQISQAYRALVRHYHPDTRGVDSSTLPAGAADSALQRILDAYTVLHDPVSRDRYDRLHPRPGAQRPEAQTERSEHRHPHRQPSPPSDQPLIQAGPVRWHPPGTTADTRQSTGEPLDPIEQLVALLRHWTRN